MQLRDLVLVLVAVAAACSGDGVRESDWRAHRESLDALSQRLWGQPMAESAVAEARTGFDCVWEDVESAGSDPRADVRCVIEQRAALVACLDGGGELAACQARADAVCALSEPALAAQRLCARPSSAPVTPPPRRSR